jgi:phosphoenolpyruvate synthase/pyruvate phosphate dikinase
MPTRPETPRWRNFGATGIGLCRTEHMFFAGDRILAVREMILADDEAGRRKALAKLLPMQRGDFEGMFREMNGLPVTIRLLDPPLHEFIAPRRGRATHHGPRWACPWARSRCGSRNCTSSTP